MGRVRRPGTFAEFAAAPAGALELKPEEVSFEQAASVPTSGYIALVNLRGSADVRPGHRVLINGAGGGVGFIALQVAKARGATVTAVDRAEKLGMLCSLGADQVRRAISCREAVHRQRQPPLPDRPIPAQSCPPAAAGLQDE